MSVRRQGQAEVFTLGLVSHEVMSVVSEIREQGRGMAGALLVLGISFAYTIETWWLAVEIPAPQ